VHTLLLSTAPKARLLAEFAMEGKRERRTMKRVTN
jgi:hypothetical protein